MSRLKSNALLVLALSGLSLHAAYAGERESDEAPVFEISDSKQDSAQARAGNLRAAIPVQILERYDDGTVRVRPFTEGAQPDAKPEFVVSRDRIFDGGALVFSAGYAGLVGAGAELGILLGDYQGGHDGMLNGYSGLVFRLGLGNEGYILGAGLGGQMGMIGGDVSLNFIHNQPRDRNFVGAEGRLRILLIYVSVGLYAGVNKLELVPTAGVGVMVPINFSFRD